MELVPTASTTRHSGWLWKEGEHGAGWKRRWFALEVAAADPGAAVLRYYEAIDAAAPKGAIPLLPGMFRVRRPKTARKEFAACLRLEITGHAAAGCRHKYILAADQKRDLEGWRAALRDLVGTTAGAGGGGRGSASGSAGRARAQPQPSRSLLMSERERCVAMATICGQARRYDEMAEHVLTLANARVDLTEPEEALLSEAFTQVARGRRGAWRALCAAEYAQEHATNGRYADRASALRAGAEEALGAHCRQVLAALEGIIPSASRPASRILYLLLLADHQRYLAEVTRGAGRLAHTKDALTTYQAAAATAVTAIPASHPVALSIALGHATLVAEMLGEEARGSAMAREAFDRALAFESEHATPDDGSTTGLEARLLSLQLLSTAADEWSAVAEELSDGEDDPPEVEIRDRHFSAR